MAKSNKKVLSAAQRAERRAAKQGRLGAQRRDQKGLDKSLAQAEGWHAYGLSQAMIARL